MTAPTTRQPLLDVAGLRVTYGGVVAVSDVDLQITEGTVFGLIGPNGAGKTSMVDALTGYTRPAAGRIVFDGRDIGGAAPLQASAPRPRADVPVGRAVRRPHRRGEPARRQRARDRRLRRSATCSCPQRPPDRPASTGPSRSAAWQDVVDRYPTEISLGKRKLVGVGRALARRPGWSCSTSPRPGSTPTRASSSASGCGPCRTSTASRSSSSTTTWASSCASATSSWCSTSAGRSRPAPRPRSATTRA